MKFRTTKDRKIKWSQHKEHKISLKRANATKLAVQLSWKCLSFSKSTKNEWSPKKL